MKILVWGINYGPEVTGIAPYNQGLCEFLVSQGNEVHMLTTFPYYPQWKKREVDRGIIYRKEEMNGVQVHRCWHYVPPQPTALQRIAHEASFVCHAFLRALFISKIDRIILISPPLPIGVAGFVLSLFKRAPFIFHIQDLQPDAGIHLGLIPSPILQRFLYFCERLIYSRANKITVISQTMKKIIENKGHPSEKILLFPNWFHPVESGVNSLFSFRESLGVPNSALLMVYSGNFGKKQGLEIFVEAAGKLASEKGHWIFCGDGAAKAELIRRVEELQLKQVYFLPLQELPRYRRLLEEADLCLVSQIGGTGRFFFPSKLLSILSHGKPVLTVANEDSELAHAVIEGFGVNHSSYSSDEIAATIEELHANPLRLKEMGERGREYVQQFDQQKILGEFEKRLKNMRG